MNALPFDCLLWIINYTLWWQEYPDISFGGWTVYASLRTLRLEQRSALWKSDEPRSYSQKWQQAQNILLLQGWSASGTGHVSACMCTTAVCQGASTGGHRRVHQRGCRCQSQLEAEAVHQRFQAVGGVDFQMDWWHSLHRLGRAIVFATIALTGPVVLGKTQCVCKKGPAVKKSRCTSNRQKSCYKGAEQSTGCVEARMPRH